MGQVLVDDSMETPNQEKVWNSISKSWSEYRVEPVKEVVEFLENKSGRVLDVGCGSGRNFIKKEGLKICGVDFSEGQLKYAKKRADEMEIEVELKKMSDEVLDYSEGYFDSIVCARVLHCVESLEKRKKLIKEIFRVLKSDGEAFFSTWSKSHPKLEGKGKECLMPWEVDRKSFERYTYIYDLEELESLLEGVGFKVLESFERGGNVFVRVVK
jgi:ubiquinone/menaquinone biosynthesis C-methylase UbiE